MRPHDEVSERNEAIELAQEGFMDPINLFKALDDPDPVNTAKMVTTFRVNPMAYLQQYFPEQAQQLQQAPQPSPIQPQAVGQSQQPQSPAPSNSSLAAVPIQKIWAPHKNMRWIKVPFTAKVITT